jgi:hypothetical protein
MNTMKLFLFIIIVTFLVNISFSQDDIAAKLTQSAIDARISEIRMGNIIVNLAQQFQINLQKKIETLCHRKTGKCFLKFLKKILTMPFMKTP